MDRFIDWGLAQRVAERVAGEGVASADFSQVVVDSACADARDLVLDYTRMTPLRPLPSPEVVDRGEWARVGLGTLRELSHAFESRVASGMKTPGPEPGPPGHGIQPVSGAMGCPGAQARTHPPTNLQKNASEIAGVTDPRTNNPGRLGNRSGRGRGLLSCAAHTQH